MSAIVSPSMSVAPTLPDHTQLPDSDGQPVQNYAEPPQSRLLIDTLEPVLHRIHPQDDYCIGRDLGIYWTLTHPLLAGAKAPDWFYVSGVPNMLSGQRRRSYVLWQEKVPPYVLLEYVSGDGSEELDQTPQKGKFWVYENSIQPNFYGIFFPDSGQLTMYELVDNRFRLLQPNQRGRYPIPRLNVELGVWHGRYENQDGYWMRWFDPQGRLLPTSAERAEEQRQQAARERQAKEEAVQRADELQRQAEQAQRQAEQERQQREQAQHQAEQAQRQADQERQQREQAQRQAELLAEKLRSLGIDPNSL